MILSPRVKLCRSCGATSADTRFPPMSMHRCSACDGIEKRERAGRIKDRGARVVVVERADPNDTPEGRAHMAWVREQPCAVRCAGCRGPMHAHHYRIGTGGGTGLKPGPQWTVPLCTGHHDETHRHGERTFGAKYQVDLAFIATDLAARSPHLGPQISTGGREE